ncbi:thioredoxin domain-containing protein [Methylobacterium sp. E-045]|uniref:thioredoxin domain-containing protein n=1 Tax=Methylobacterium sp. E-045 TaxID=2836575 RepID=UPI001FB8854F|nr:thioredoxin domain-containing protein [Methylobacterium sp. E-045]MCJ2132176.1 DsbA family protein [Methylobacterium sp. E-045]
MRSTEGTAAGRSTRRNLLTGPILFGAAWAMATLPSDALATAVGDPSMAGPLGDIWIGASDAKVRLIEYAAVTCSHCAAFHERTLPAIRTRWIDTGRVRFALRGFPLNPLDTAAFMLARSDGGRHYYAITDLLFEKQATWAFVPKPLDAMRDLLRQAGFDRAKFDAVLADQALYDHVNRVQARATEGLGVHATPTLFVNDARYEGALTGDGFDEVIAKLPG